MLSMSPSQTIGTDREYEATRLTPPQAYHQIPIIFGYDEPQLRGGGGYKVVPFVTNLPQRVGSSRAGIMSDERHHVAPVASGFKTSDQHDSQCQ